MCILWYRDWAQHFFIQSSRLTAFSAHLLPPFPISFPFLIFIVVHITNISVNDICYSVLSENMLSMRWILSNLIWLIFWPQVCVMTQNTVHLINSSCLLENNVFSTVICGIFHKCSNSFIVFMSLLISKSYTFLRNNYWNTQLLL